MYPAGDPVHEWLQERVPRWDRLGRAIFRVSCFLKSQNKRSPTVCDNVLFRLWCGWEDAFPGMSFNKYHGMFCAIHDYVHQYHMAGRVSEESNEAYNGTLKEVKRILRCMVSDESRTQKITERSQINLNSGVVDKKLEISNRIKGKERGPYGRRMRRGDNQEVLRSEQSVRDVDGERFVVLNSGNLLPEKWLDIYE